MFKLWKLATLFALIATLPSKIQALATDQDEASHGLAPQTLNDDTLSPSLYVDDAFSPETQGLYNELESMAPEYQYPSPEINEDDQYPYPDNPSIYPPSPSPATYIDDQALAPELEDVGDDQVSESPSPSPSPSELDSGIVSDYYYDIVPHPQVEAHAPVLPFNYSAEDDSGEFTSEDYDEQDYSEEQKKNGSGIGYLVVGAVCVLGLGGLAYKKTRDDKRKHYHMYELAKC